MTNMTDRIRILLKAYGEELTLEQITKILAGRAENLKDEIKKAIPELLASKQIIQTKDNIYKTACEEKPNYFFVFHKYTTFVKTNIIFGASFMKKSYMNSISILSSKNTFCWSSAGFLRISRLI